MDKYFFKNLENVILSKVRQKMRNIIWQPLYVGYKKKWYKLTYLQKEVWTQWLREGTYGFQRDTMGQGTVREFEIDMYTLLCLKWMTNKDLLYTAWNSVQCGSLDRREIWGRMTTHIVVVVQSLSYVQQTRCSMDCSTPDFPVSSLSPWVCSNLCHMSRWCFPTTPSFILFSSCLQSFPASGSFPMHWPFTSGGQSIGISASTSVLPMNIQGWFPFGLTDLISLLSKKPSRVFFSTTIQKYPFFGAQPSLCSTSYICTWLLEKIIAFEHTDLCHKVMSLLFDTLSRFVIVCHTHICMAESLCCPPEVSQHC